MLEMAEEEMAPASPNAAGDGGPGAWARRHRRAIGVGATTVAFALGGALAGAAAFSAGAGSASAPGAAPQRLATSSSPLPPAVRGSICGSQENTATAADTAIACRSFGVDSYRAVTAQAFQRARALQAAFAPLAAARPKSLRSPSLLARRATSGRSGSAEKASRPVGSGGTATSKPKSSSTCVSTPAGVSLPGVPSTTLTVPLGSAGGVSVSTGSSGAKICLATGSKKSKRKSTTTGSKNPAPSSTTTTTTTTTNPVQSVLNGVSGTVSGITGGL